MKFKSVLLKVQKLDEVFKSEQINYKLQTIADMILTNALDKNMRKRNVALTNNKFQVKITWKEMNETLSRLLAHEIKTKFEEWMNEKDANKIQEDLDIIMPDNFMVTETAVAGMIPRL